MPAPLTKHKQPIYGPAAPGGGLMGTLPEQPKTPALKQYDWVTRKDPPAKPPVVRKTRKFRPELAEAMGKETSEFREPEGPLGGYKIGIEARPEHRGPEMGEADPWSMRRAYDLARARTMGRQWSQQGNDPIPWDGFIDSLKPWDFEDLEFQAHKAKGMYEAHEGFRSMPKEDQDAVTGQIDTDVADIKMRIWTERMKAEHDVPYEKPDISGTRQAKELAAKYPKLAMQAYEFMVAGNYNSKVLGELVESAGTDERREAFMDLLRVQASSLPPEKLSDVKKFFTTIRQHTLDVGRSIESFTAEYIAPLVASEDEAAALEQWQKHWRFQAAVIAMQRGANPIEAETWVGDAVYGAAAMFPAMAISAGVPGGTVAKSAYWMTQIAPNRLQEMEALGIDTKIAKWAALGSSMLEAPVEMLQWKGLTNVHKGTAIRAGWSAVAKYIANGLKEAGTTYVSEMSEEAIQGAIAIFATAAAHSLHNQYSDDPNLGDFDLDAQLESFKKEMIQAGLSMPLLMAAGQFSQVATDVRYTAAERADTKRRAELDKKARRALGRVATEAEAASAGEASVEAEGAPVPTEAGAETAAEAAVEVEKPTEAEPKQEEKADAEKAGAQVEGGGEAKGAEGGAGGRVRVRDDAEGRVEAEGRETEAAKQAEEVGPKPEAAPAKPRPVAEKTKAVAPSNILWDTAAGEIGGRQVWKMTREEFYEIAKSRLPEGHFGRNKSRQEGLKQSFRTTAQVAYYAHVEQAVLRGESVPMQVLKQFAGKEWADAAMAKLAPSAAKPPVVPRETAAKAKPVAAAEKKAKAKPKKAMTKAKLQAAHRAHLLATNITDMVEKETKRSSAARKRKLESAMISLRTSAGKVGVNVPQVGTFYDPTEYQRIAAAAQKQLPDWTEVSRQWHEARAEKQRAKNMEVAAEKPETAPEPAKQVEKPKKRKKPKPVAAKKAKAEKPDKDAKMREKIAKLVASGHTSLVKFTGGTQPMWALMNSEGDGPRLTDPALVEYARQQIEAKAAKYTTGLPELNGSEKQIAWATDIRRDVLEAWDTIVTPKFADKGAAVKQIIAQIGKRIASTTSAKWFIDRREVVMRDGKGVAISGSSLRQLMTDDEFAALKAARKSAPVATPPKAVAKPKAEAAPEKPKPAAPAAEAEAPVEPAKPTSEMTLREAEAAGLSPYQVSQEDWVNMRRRHMRELGQSEQGDNPNAPYADSEEYHRTSVREALAMTLPVPRVALEAYKGEDWAKKAIKAMELAEPKTPGDYLGKHGTASGGVSGMPVSSKIKPGVMPGKAEAKITAPDIIKAMETASGTPIRYGHGSFKQRKALGWFDPKHDLIRQQTANRLDVAAHEFGHSVHKKILNWELKFPPGVRAELLAMGKALYGKRKPKGGYQREGFAEYMARFLLGEEMGESAPKTHEWFTNTVLPQHSEFASKLFGIRQMYGQWNVQGAAGRVASQINRAQAGPIGKLKTAWDKLSWLVSRQAWMNDAAPLEDAEAMLLAHAKIKPETLRPDQSPSKVRAALKMNAKGTARHFVYTAAVDPNGTIIGPSLSDVLQPVKKRMDAFLVYAYASRGLLLHSRGINPGISKADAEYVVNDLHSPEFEAAVRGITEWTGYLLDYVVDSGGLSAEAADAIRVLNPIYLPLKRHFDETYLGGQRGAKSGVVDQGTAIKKIKGSGRQIIDPRESLLQQAEHMISLGNKLQVARTLVELAESVEGGAWFANKIPPPIEAQSFQMKDIADQLKDIGVDVDEASLDQVLTVFNNAARYTGKENIVVIWRNGKREFWELHPDVYRVVTDMDKEYLPASLRMLFGPFKRAVQLGATGLDASFSLIRNPIRDSLTGTVYGQSATATPLRTVEGIWRELSKDPSAQRWQALGGKMATLMGQDRAATRRALEEALARGVKEKGVMVVKHPIDALRGALGVTESGTRIAEFNAVMKTAEAKWGVGSRAATIEAMLASKDATVNFTRQGVLAGAINQMVPFFNARMQGTSKFWRAFIRAKGRTALLATAKAVAWITIPSLLIWWVHRDDDWYRELPRWRRQGFWNFSFNDGETIWSIPKPFELGYVFGSVPETIADAAYRENPEDVSDTAWETFKSFLPAESAVGLLPPAIKPTVEIITNYDEFRGRHIVPPWMEEARLPQDRYSKYTTETAKALGKFFHVSPMKVEHWISGHTGGLALDLVRGAETFTGVREKGPVKTVKDIPVVGTLFARDPYAYGKSLNMLYERRAALRQKNNSKTITRAEEKQLERLESAGRAISDWRKERDGTDNPATKKALNEKMTARARKALVRE